MNSISLSTPNNAGRLLDKKFGPTPPLPTATLPQPYPPTRIWFWTGVAVACAATVAMASRRMVLVLWDHTPSAATVGVAFHDFVMLLAVGVLAYALLRRENNRRAANIVRYRAIAEANHHIRNALQVITFTAAQRREIADAVLRIELTLSEVLPVVLEE